RTRMSLVCVASGRWAAGGAAPDHAPGRAATETSASAAVATATSARGIGERGEPDARTDLLSRGADYSTPPAGARGRPPLARAAERRCRMALCVGGAGRGEEPRVDHEGIRAPGQGVRAQPPAEGSRAPGPAAGFRGAAAGRG